MAVNIYDELARAHARIDALEGRSGPKLAPVTYFYPGVRWDTTLAKNPALTIINPGSGPGTIMNSAYHTQVAKCRAAGVSVIGYVHTKYSLRPAAEVKTDIDRHFAWYGVDGIFIDTTSNKLEHVAYYADLAAHIRAKGGIVVLNPGTSTLEAHARIADHVMVSETDAATYRQQTRPAWEAKFPASKFWHCVHTCPAAEMPEIVALAKARNAGLLYVTDDVMANPYNVLPTYFDALVAAL